MAGVPLAPGDEIPPGLWASVSERTRRALRSIRLVRDTEDPSPLQRLPSKHQKAPQIVTIQKAEALPAAEALTCSKCGYVAQSKQGLGGHMRGHAKRKE